MASLIHREKEAIQGEKRKICGSMPPQLEMRGKRAPVHSKCNASELEEAHVAVRNPTFIPASATARTIAAVAINHRGNEGPPALFCDGDVMGLVSARCRAK